MVFDHCSVCSISYTDLHIPASYLFLKFPEILESELGNKMGRDDFPMCQLKLSDGRMGIYPQFEKSVNPVEFLCLPQPVQRRRFQKALIHLSIQRDVQILISTPDARASCASRMLVREVTYVS